MKNPYINEENPVAKPAPSGLDKAINDTAAKLPFVPNNFNSAGFLKGVLLGAGAAYILSNPKAQETLFKAIIKGTSLLNAGIEELKERFEDVKAELEANS